MRGSADHVASDWCLEWSYPETLAEDTHPVGQSRAVPGSFLGGGSKKLLPNTLIWQKKNCERFDTRHISHRLPCPTPSPISHVSECLPLSLPVHLKQVQQCHLVLSVGVDMRLSHVLVWSRPTVHGGEQCRWCYSNPMETRDSRHGGRRCSFSCSGALQFLKDLPKRLTSMTMFLTQKSMYNIHTIFMTMSCDPRLCKIWLALSHKKFHGILSGDYTCPLSYSVPPIGDPYKFVMWIRELH